jgi:HAD superfamily hydrolase (TIGR01509 family)
MKTILVDTIDTLVIEGEGVFEPMHKLLDEYPNSKIILSNADDEEMIAFGLTDLPYELFTLKHNPNKTDPFFFTEMLEHFGLERNNVVYFEHNEEAVKSAQSVGITSYQYDSVARDMDALKQFLDKNL